MAASRNQRVGIWIITSVLFIGTIAGFIAMMVAPGNEAKDQAQLKADTERYKKAYTDYKTKVDEQAKGLSEKFYAVFSAHVPRVAAFDSASAAELKTEDVLVGNGTEIKDDTQFAAYYIGWNPKGEIFDQSIHESALKAPFIVEGLKHASLITGWKEGLIGMKVGGVRELTVPADKAYGKSGSGDKIPADTPLKFIVMAIEKPETIPEPQMPDSVKKSYRGL